MKILRHGAQMLLNAPVWRQAVQVLAATVLLLLAATGAHAQAPDDASGSAGAAAVIPVNICLPEQLPLSGTEARAVNSEPALSYNGDRAAFWSTANPIGTNADGSIELFAGIIEAPDAAGVFTPTVAQITESRGNILGGFNIMPDVAYATLAGASSAFTVFASDRDLAPTATINNRDGGFEIFIARRTGSNVTIAQLTNGRGNASILPSMSNLYPDASPRFVNVAFVSDADDKDAANGAVPVGPAGNSNYELYAMKLDLSVWPPTTVGSIIQVTQTANDVTNDKPAMSQNGNAIVFLSDAKAPLRPAAGAPPSTRDLNREVFRVLLPATFSANAPVTFTQVTNTGVDGGTIIDNDDPDCNDDGTRVVFSSTEQSFTNTTPNAGKPIVYLSDLRGNAPTYLAVSNALKVSGNPAFTAKEPALSGVGDRIVFAADACAVASQSNCSQHTGEFQVFVAERDVATGGILVAQVTNELTATHEAPAISGDGRFVALVKSEGNAAVNPDLSGSEVAILYCPDARLEPIKSVDNRGQSLVNERPDVGDVVDYVVSFKNGGLATFEETMAFTDTLPAQVAFVGFVPDTLPDGVVISPYVYNAANRTVSWTLRNVPFGQLATVRIQAQVLRTYGPTNALVAGSTIANRVFMTPTTVIPDITSGKLKITHDAAAEMSVTRVDLSAGVKLSTQTPREGEAVNVSFTITNAAASAANPLGALDPATNVVLTTTLPALNKYTLQVAPGVNISGTWEVNGNIGTWTVLRIDASKKATLALRLTPRAGFGGTAADSFAIGVPRSSQQDDNTANNIVGGATRQVRIVGTDLQLVSKTVNERRPPQNSYVTYAIVVRNNGPLGATPGSDPAYDSNPNAFRPSVVVVQDPLPVGVVFHSASAEATQVPAVGQPGTVTWEIPNLALGASRTLTVTAQVVAVQGTRVVNTVNSLRGYILPDKSVVMPDPTAANNGPVSDAFTTNTPVAVGLKINPEPKELNEGEQVTLTVLFTDTDILDTHTLTVTWGDGQSVVKQNPNDASGGLTEVFTHVYADDNAADSFPIAVTVSDGRQATLAAEPVKVHNVLPVSTLITATNPAGFTGTMPVVLFGAAPLTIRQTFSDPGFSVAGTVTQTVVFTESFSYRIDWGDGVVDASVPVPAANVVNGRVGVATTGELNATHAYATLGTFTVRVFVSDDDGSAYPTTPTATMQVLVARVPLAVDDRNSTVDEDSAVVIDVLANDGADTPTVTAVNTTGMRGEVVVDAGGGGVTYTATGHFDALKQGAQATDRFGYTLRDRLGFTASAFVTVTVTGINDLPVLDLNGATAGVTTTAAFVEDAGAVVVAPAALLTDLDDTLMNAASVQIQNLPDGTSELLQVTPVAPITAAYNPATGLLTLSGQAGINDYRTTLARVAYLNNSQNPDTTPRILVFNVRDQQAGNALPVNATVTVARTDDPPVVTTTAGETSIVEGAAATRVDPGVTVTDVDNSDNFAGGALAVTVQAGVKWDELSIVSGNNVSVSGANVLYNGVAVGTFTGGGSNQIVVSFGTGANAAIAQAVAQQVGYTRKSGPKPETATKVVTFVVRSSATGAASNTAGKTVRLTGVNDAPVITFGTFPAVPEETATNIRSSFTVTDVDTTGVMSMTVRVANGTLTYTSAGLTPTGNGTSQITVQGTRVQLNAAATLTYIGNLNFFGIETITVAVNDNDTGPGPLRVTTNSTFNVTNVNDAPTLAVTNVTGALEDQPLPVAGLITLGDVDAQATDTAWLTATVSSNGRLTVVLPLPAGISQSGSGTAQVVLRGTLAALNAWKANAGALLYQGTPNFFGNETLTVRFSDGASAAPANLAATPVARNFIVAAVNDAPALLLAQVPNANESAPVSVGGLITINDVDTIATDTAVLTTTVLHGTLSVSPATPAGLTVSANPNAQVVVRGTVAAINAWKAQTNALVYRATANYLGSDTLTVRFNDGSTVAPTNLAAPDAASTFTVAAINDAPVITLQPMSADEDVDTNIHPFIAVADADSIATTMRMTITVQNGTLLYTGAPPAGSGSNTNRLVLDGTLAQLNNTNPINYRGPLNVFGSTIITVTVNDGDSAAPGPRTTTAVGAITINAVNDAPVLDLNGPSLPGTDVSATFTEDAGAILLAPGAVTITDIEGNSIAGATIELANRPDGAAETLTAVGASGITVSTYNPATGQLLLTGPASPASYTAWQNVLKSVRYNNTSANPTTTPRTINFRVGDNGSPAQPSNVAVATVNVIGVNDQPLLTLAASASVNEDAPLSVGGLIVITDVDPQPAETATLTATVAHGTLTLLPAAPANLVVSGSGTAQVVIAGTLSNINAWKAGTNALVYQGVLDYNGADALVVNYRDGSGTANQAAAQKTTAITVVAVADAPTLESITPGLSATLAMTPTDAFTPTVTSAMLAASDVDSDAAGIVYTVVAQPATGTLLLAGAPLAACGVFTQQDIDNNLVTYAFPWEGEAIGASFAFNLANEANCTGPGTAFTIDVTAAP